MKHGGCGNLAILKLKIVCRRCGLYIGDYYGEDCFLMPQTSKDLKVLCKDCSQAFRRRGRGRLPNSQMQKSIRILGEEVKS